MNLMQQTHTHTQHYDCVCVFVAVSQMARAGHTQPKAPLCQVCQTGLIAAAALCVCVLARVCVWLGRWIPNNDTGTDSAPQN